MRRRQMVRKPKTEEWMKTSYNRYLFALAGVAAEILPFDSATQSLSQMRNHHC